MYESSLRHPVWVPEINVNPCNSVLIGWDPATPPPFPPHLGSYPRTLYISQDKDISLEVVVSPVIPILHVSLEVHEYESTLFKRVSSGRSDPSVSCLLYDQVLDKVPYFFVPGWH